MDRLIEKTLTKTVIINNKENINKSVASAISNKSEYQICKFNNEALNNKKLNDQFDGKFKKLFSMINEEEEKKQLVYENGKEIEPEDDLLRFKNTHSHYNHSFNNNIKNNDSQDDLLNDLFNNLNEESNQNKILSEKLKNILDENMDF